MYIRPLGFLLLIGAAALSATGQELGAYGYLSLPASAHAAALGGTLVSAVDPEVELAEQNPSLLCPDMSGQVALGYMNYLADINIGYAAYDPSYGARPLRRYLQKHVETLAAKEILRDNVHEGRTWPSGWASATR